MTFPGYGAVDAAVQYAIPVFRSLRPYVKVDVFNVLNNQKAIAFNTTVVPDFGSPLDSLGLPTTYFETADFGEPDDNRHYPAPLPGLTGGRTVRIAVGLRF